MSVRYQEFISFSETSVPVGNKPHLSLMLFVAMLCPLRCTAPAPRGARIPSDSALTYFLMLYPCLELKEPVGQIVCTDKGILAAEQNKVLVPPTWSKTFAWGYADLSCRLANYESDKVRDSCFDSTASHSFKLASALPKQASLFSGLLPLRVSDLHSAACGGVT